jgi:hypothetical protein
MTNNYKWLIIVEGKTDQNALYKLLPEYDISASDFKIISAGGKNGVLNAPKWNENILSTVLQDTGRKGFYGIILIIDSDENYKTAFTNYKNNKNFNYISEYHDETKKYDNYLLLDVIDGESPKYIFGVTVPQSANGSLETLFLEIFGYPKKGQDDYSRFTDIIKTASSSWNLSNLGENVEWWKENTDAKFDKFIYYALSKGFEVVEHKSQFPLNKEPSLIKNIKSIMNDAK